MNTVIKVMIKEMEMDFKRIIKVMVDLIIVNVIGMSMDITISSASIHKEYNESD